MTVARDRRIVATDDSPYSRFADSSRSRSRLLAYHPCPCSWRLTVSLCVILYPLYFPIISALRTIGCHILDVTEALVRWVSLQSRGKARTVFFTLAPHSC